MLKIDSVKRNVSFGSTMGSNISKKANAISQRETEKWIFLSRKEAAVRQSPGYKHAKFFRMLGIENNYQEVKAQKNIAHLKMAMANVVKKIFK